MSNYKKDKMPAAPRKGGVFIQKGEGFVQKEGPAIERKKTVDTDLDPAPSPKPETASAAKAETPAAKPSQKKGA
ncbi:MAG: hypothetical protein ACSHXY_09840 [Alphaproteobacteria bacterium]